MPAAGQMVQIANPTPAATAVRRNDCGSGAALEKRAAHQAVAAAPAQPSP